VALGAATWAPAPAVEIGVVPGDEEATGLSRAYREHHEDCCSQDDEAKDGTMGQKSYCHFSPSRGTQNRCTAHLPLSSHHPTLGCL
jgi:hypothetical protein